MYTRISAGVENCPCFDLYFLLLISLLIVKLQFILVEKGDSGARKPMGGATVAIYPGPHLARGASSTLSKDQNTL